MIHSCVFLLRLPAIMNLMNCSAQPSTLHQPGTASSTGDPAYLLNIDVNEADACLSPDKDFLDAGYHDVPCNTALGYICL